jgi:hypothetical protein
MRQRASRQQPKGSAKSIGRAWENLVLFVCGLMTGTIASILLLVFLRVSFLNPSSVEHVNVTAGEILMTAFLVAFISIPLAWAGRNAERGLATACGLSLIVLLYMAGLATSI